MMKRGAASSITLLLSALAAHVVAQSERASIEVYDAKGEPVLGMSIRDAPAPGDLTPSNTARFERDVKLPDGRTARGIGLRAWHEGATVRVLVVTLMPNDPTRQDRHPWFRTEAFQIAKLASFTLDAGQSRRLDEMKSLGLAPMSVTLFPAGQHAH
jgi:hypothetical protein